jgi:hypothetical protein
MAKKTFTIEVTMEERWIPHFMSALELMENLGKVGSSQTVGIFADGDGDFRPTFKTDQKFESVYPRPGNIFDAG